MNDKPNYIEQAQRTSSPINAEVVSRAINPNVICDLASEIARIIEVGSAIDDIKKHIFYGKPMVKSYDPEPVANLDAIRGRMMNDRAIKLLHASLGLITEAAELAETVVSHIIGGYPMDSVNIIEELGDNQWYVAEACAAIDTNIEIVQTINIKKLKRRYPDKFTNENAINRDHDAERKVIEKNIS